MNIYYIAQIANSLLTFIKISGLVSRFLSSECSVHRKSIQTKSITVPPPERSHTQCTHKVPVSGRIVRARGEEAFPLEVWIWRPAVRWQSWGTAPSLPAVHPYTPYDLRDTQVDIWYTQSQWIHRSVFSYFMNGLPIPNGINCSFLSSFPSSSRKRDGLKVSGSSHTVGSLWTDHRLGKTTVPLGIV